MSAEPLNISRFFIWEERLPRPQWERVGEWINSRCEPGDRADAWVAAGRQWLAELNSALGGDYQVSETDHFLAVAPEGRLLLQFAERGRAALLSALDGVAGFSAPGKQIVIALRTPDHYYRYVAPHYPEGEHGGSGGIHIRDDYPHVALYGKDLWVQENTLAHELTHASLHHLSMPQWLEEGLAQVFEHDLTGRAILLVDIEMAQRHKAYWAEHGMEEFWRGDGFSSSGDVQELSYQLAEILVRLLIEESHPRWFGWVREPRRRFFAFLRGAQASDCGDASCREHLGVGVGELAARFLGPGDWPPSTRRRRQGWDAPYS